MTYNAADNTDLKSFCHLIAPGSVLKPQVTICMDRNFPVFSGCPSGFLSGFSGFLELPKEHSS